VVGPRPDPLPRPGEVGAEGVSRTDAALAVDVLTASIEPAWRQREGAPAAGTRVCDLEEVPDGSAREFHFGEGRDVFRLLVLRSGGKVWGYVNVCPHFSTPLNTESNKFILFEHSRIYCATHCAVFRFEDGYCEDGPCAGASLERVPLALEASVVSIGID
jgi:nitrite reductase/ring-hydroxylating ferredoxin subunit